MTQSLTQAEKAAANFSDEDLNRQMHDLVQYLLIHGDKSLIRKTDINKNVLKEYSKCFKLLMDRASKKLLDVYGIQVLEHEDKKGGYILVNSLASANDPSCVLISEEDTLRTGLLVPILGLIFMSGNVVTDDVLWKFIQHLLKLKRETSTHPVFGDIRKIIFTDFVRQDYLIMTSIPDTDPVVHELYGNTPSDWPQQLQDAEGDGG